MSQLHFIDAHHHLWDLDACHYPWLMARGEARFFGDPTPIQQHYSAEDFLNESPCYRPAHSVHIQVGVAEQDSIKESAWLQQQSPVPDAIVAFADLAAADLPQTLEAHSQYAKLRGIRQIVGRHVDEDHKHNDRVMFGSNFPVDKLYRSYATLWSAYEVITQDFSADEKHSLFFANARDFYRLKTA